METIVNRDGLSSLPTRERGLKLVALCLEFLYQVSLPTRERGLKLVYWRYGYTGGGVAPYAGAWIETPGVRPYGAQCSVAPYAGAWIETLNDGNFIVNSEVAPYAGAWIET